MDGKRAGNPEGQVLADLQFAEAVNSEDRRRRGHALKHHLPPGSLTVPQQPRKPRTSELLKCVHSQRQAADGGWRSALKDPETAAAMRALRRRVLKLTDYDAQPATAPELANEWSFRMLNEHQGRCGQRIGPRHRQLLTSLEHPLAYSEHCLGCQKRLDGNARVSLLEPLVIDR